MQESSTAEVSGPPAGWSKQGHNWWIGVDEAEVRKAIDAHNEDKKNCPTCQHGDYGPRRASGYHYYTADQLRFNSYQCESGSRWYDPTTGKMEGRAHCACNRCF